MKAHNQTFYSVFMKTINMPNDKLSNMLPCKVSRVQKGHTTFGPYYSNECNVSPRWATTQHTKACLILQIRNHPPKKETTNTDQMFSAHYHAILWLPHLPLWSKFIQLTWNKL